MRAFLGSVAFVGTLLLCGCAGGVAQSAGSTPVVRQLTGLPQQPTAVTESASPLPTADAVYARASGILLAADNHLRSFLATGQSLGDDRPAVARWALSVVTWVKNDGDIFEQAQNALPVAGASSGLNSWGTDFTDADMAVVQYASDRFTGASASTIAQDLAQAQNGLNQVDSDAKLVAVGQ